uniref:ER membrane protein complex subunit 8 n=1 Tax=Podarcis muralis TaxID=64176 RepID=A0A670KBY0_PODMU
TLGNPPTKKQLCAISPHFLKFESPQIGGHLIDRKVCQYNYILPEHCITLKTHYSGCLGCEHDLCGRHIHNPYTAGEKGDTQRHTQVVEKVASRIAEGFNDTALIMVDNSKFTMECIELTVHVYEHHENKWRCKDPHFDYCEDWSEAQRISASLLDSWSYETLVDFDNHLDDIRNDWTNPEINKAVLHLC